MSCPACAATAACAAHPSQTLSEQAERAAVATLVLLAVSEEGLCSTHTFQVVRATEDAKRLMEALDRMANGDLSLLAEAEVVRDACLLSPKLARRTLPERGQ